MALIRKKLSLIRKTIITILILQPILVNTQTIAKNKLLRGSDDERLREVYGEAIEEERIIDTNAEYETNVTEVEDEIQTTTDIYKVTDIDNEAATIKIDNTNARSLVDIDYDADYRPNETVREFKATDKPTAIALTAQEAEEEDEGQERNQSDHENDRQGEEGRTPPFDATEQVNTMSDLDSNAIAMRYDVKTESSSSSPPSSLTPLPRSTDTPEVSQSTMSVREMDIPEQRSLKTNTEQEPEHRQESKISTSPTAATKCLTLKSWLEDPWLRPPAGILVPLRPSAIHRALGVWNDLIAQGLMYNDVVLIGYDSNGVSWRSHHNIQRSPGTSHKTVAETLSKLLLKYQGLNAASTNDATMKALASSAQLVPYDSALVLLTDRGAADADRRTAALRALVHKRLKVYTIWTDPSYPSQESEQALEPLRNVSQHTEGDVLPYSLEVEELEKANMAAPGHWEPKGQSSRQGRGNALEDEKMDILMVRRGGGEAISLGVPVEGGVTALRVYIEGLVEHAVLYPPYDDKKLPLQMEIFGHLVPPKGRLNRKVKFSTAESIEGLIVKAPQIDLYNATSVQQFSPHSRTDGLSPRDVYLVFPGAKPDDDSLSVLPKHPTSSPSESSTVGQWHLSVRCDTCDYRLCLTARSLIHAYATLQDTDQLKIRVIGPVASVRESLLVDEYGNELAKLPFSYDPTSGDGHDLLDTPTELTEDITLPKVKGAKVYVKIVGRDMHGSPFVRLCGPITSESRVSRSAVMPYSSSVNDLERAEEINSKEYQYQRVRFNDSAELPYSRAVSQLVTQQGSLLTTVQIGLATKLYGAPGDTLQLHFEVTNYRDERATLVFGAVDELRFLRSVTPQTQNVVSGQTVNVILNVLIPTTAQPGARDLITFTVYELRRELVSINAFVYVLGSGIEINDIWPPEMRHNFQGSCIGRQGADCAQHAWSVTVIARDTNSGLLRLSSTPIGLMYDSNFVAGTREEISAVYRATCCAPRIVVTAVDAAGNVNSYVVDISNYINEAGIAAIVLGILLLIALICLIVFLIYWCVRRRKESRELPTYSTSSRNIS